MIPGLPGRDRHSLVVPYALYALGPRELRRFERHLRRCPPCAAELRAFTDDTVRLAAAVTVGAPAALRERVLGEVRVTEQERPRKAAAVRTTESGSKVPRSRAPLAKEPARARARRFAPGPVAAAAAALALVAAVLLGVRLLDTQDRLDEQRAAAREVAQVLAAPDARATGDRDARGRTIGVVASPELDLAVITVTGLGPAPAGRVPQLWLMGAGNPRSLGLLDGDTPVVAEGLDRRATRLAVTYEPAGGSVRPTRTPTVQLALESGVFGE
ncbi:anti-sigma factor [Streptomyces sp. NBC_01304]|uniref:anti-sigma factor n=1 Tax=Streptomyces sp. NBC_01304 TaxID=2903818 RepID=UPI002E0F7D84|nr:anti-sigma factor [Streptomyces sp. NBC_01304]